MIADIPMPSFIPVVHHQFNKYLAFDLNFASIFSMLYIAYYFALEPVAAVRFDLPPTKRS
jgi:hypothetical protein